MTHCPFRRSWSRDWHRHWCTCMALQLDKYAPYTAKALVREAELWNIVEDKIMNGFVTIVLVASLLEVWVYSYTYMYISNNNNENSMCTGMYMYMCVGGRPSNPANIYAIIQCLCIGTSYKLHVFHTLCTSAWAKWCWISSKIKNPQRSICLITLVMYIQCFVCYVDILYFEYILLSSNVHVLDYTV